MIRAQEDPEFTQVILERLEPFLKYLAYIIYDFYGARHDFALDKDDIMSYLRMSVFQAVKSYDPSKYDPVKDSHGARNYLDGFRYISSIAKRLVKKFHAYHHREKRIPPEIVCSLEPEFYVEMNPEEATEISDLDMMIDGMIETFSDKYHKGINIKEVMRMLFTGNSHKDIAKTMRTRKKVIEEIIVKVTSDCVMESGQIYFPFFEEGSNGKKV
jgi:hypothetical protein